MQFRRTFDFFESVMRYFSYCSMLKIKFGMAFVSRRSFAYQDRTDLHEQICLRPRSFLLYSVSMLLFFFTYINTQTEKCKNAYCKSISLNIIIT